jgi:DNA-binding NtrC family response regulator
VERFSLFEALDRYELTLLKYALEMAPDNISERARILGVSRQVLYNKEYRFGLSKKKPVSKLPDAFQKWAKVNNQRETSYKN